MAALNLTEVKEVIEMGKVPIDICCASMNYFLKISKPSYIHLYISATPGETVSTSVQSTSMPPDFNL